MYKTIRAGGQVRNGKVHFWTNWPAEPRFFNPDCIVPGELLRDFSGSCWAYLMPLPVVFLS